MLKHRFHLHNVAASLAVCVHAVNRSQNQFFLQMAKSHNILESLLSLDLRVSSNDAKTSARSIKQAPIKLFEQVGEFSTVLARHDAVCYTKSVHVCIQ
jgi:hypothetical protein